MSQALRLALALGMVLAVGTLLRRRDARMGRPTDQSGSRVALLPLARTEAWRLARHPAHLVVVALLMGGTLLLAFVFDQDDRTIGAEGFVLVPIVCGVAGLVLIVGSARVASRSRRDGTDELLAALPTAPATHTAAHLLAGWGPVPILVGAPVVVTFVLSTRYVHLMSISDEIEALLPELLLGVLALVGASVVGVIAARWLPFPMSPVVLVAAIAVLNNSNGNLDPRGRFLRMAQVEAGFLGRFDIVPLAWHMGLVFGLVVLGAGVALARDGVPRIATAIVAIGSLIVVVGGYEATRPPSAGQIATRVAELTEPASHQRCQEHSGLRLCAFDGTTSFRRVWAEAASGVLRSVPTSARPGRLDVIQRPSISDLHKLLPDVRKALDPALAWRDDGAVHPGLDLITHHAGFEVASQTAGLVVGLPAVVVAARPLSCDARGQARLVLAYWLAGQATPGTGRTLRRLAAEPKSTEAVVTVDMASVYDNSGLSVVGEIGYGGGLRDLRQAVVLLDRPAAEVAAVVAAGWARWTDPATPAADLFAAAGVGDLPGAGVDRLIAERACP